jgi:hypothetical protein
MTLVSAALSVAAGTGCSEVFDTAIFQSGRPLPGRQVEEGGGLID